MAGKVKVYLTQTGCIYGVGTVDNQDFEDSVINAAYEWLTGLLRTHDVVYGGHGKSYAEIAEAHCPDWIEIVYK